MVLPIIICLIKPSSPICKEESAVTTMTPPDDEEYSQEELLKYGGLGLLFSALLILFFWAFAKALKYKRRERQRIIDGNTAELQEIRRQVEGGRKLI